MRYTTTLHAESRGRYGFATTLSIQQAEDGRIRILRSGFTWRGNQGGLSVTRQGPLSSYYSERLTSQLAVLRSELDEAEELAYSEVSCLVERVLVGCGCDAVEIP